MRKVTLNKTTQVKGTTAQVVTPQKALPKGKPSLGYIFIPYTQGLGEGIKKISNKYGIQTHFKGNRTSKQLLVKPKDQDPINKKSGAIYMYL